MPTTVTAISMEFAAALGLLPNTQVGRPTGYVATSATTAKAIRATTYTPQGADAQRSFASSSANDAAAGSGARKIKVTYLTAAFAEKTETVTLNGTTGVNSAALDIAFLQSMEVAEVGTQGGGNAGTISIYTQTNKGGSVWGSIAAEDGATYWAHHYVPAGRTCYLLSLSAGSTVVGGSVALYRSGGPLTVTEPQRVIGGTYVHPILGNTDHVFKIPVPITGPDFVWLVDRPIAATASTCYGSFEYFENW